MLLDITSILRILATMRFSEITLANFKNYETAKLHFHNKVNLIYGDNGSGKTNLLDALYYCSLTKSYFGLPDKNIVREGEEWMRVTAQVDTQKGSDELVIKYKLPRTKSVEINGDKLPKVSELVGRYPVVLIAPNDIKLVYDGSKERRDVVNRILSQCDRQYLEHLMVYNRYLAQKNAHLKNTHSVDMQLLRQYNENLMLHGQYIREKRKAFALEFLPWVQSNYDAISEGRESVGMTYKTDYDCESIEQLYAKTISDEITARRIKIGTHRDDMEYTIRELPLKKYGSQGQIKSYLYALRLAEYQYLKEYIGEKPILILDDFFEKLDQHRLAQLILLINSDTFDQIFLSDTELARSKRIFEEHQIDYAAYEVAGGVVKLC